jgi:hypothetical protein
VLRKKQKVHARQFRLNFRIQIFLIMWTAAGKALKSVNSQCVRDYCRLAMESDSRFREKVSSRADQTAEMRCSLQGEKEANAAQLAWEQAMSVFPWHSN